MRAAGVREVLITYGSEGAVIYGAGAPIVIAAVPPRRTVDATGCGDTFLAAYLARRIASEDLRECGEFAAAAAAINIETFGRLSRLSGRDRRATGGREPQVRMAMVEIRPGSLLLASWRSACRPVASARRCQSPRAWVPTPRCRRPRRR